MVARAIPRLLEARVREALADTPVILIHGPRQCGKTTLARIVGAARGYTYSTFDDDSLREAALFDPTGFVARLPRRVILDEVQRVPALFAAIKAAVDAHRQPGRFILTGSANVLLLPALADSLAGRMALLRLHPFAQCEIERTRPTFIDTVFEGGCPQLEAPPLGRELARLMTRGGFPSVFGRRAESRRAAWYRDYIETQVRRDVRDLSRLRSFDALPRLLSVVAGHTASLVNVAELAGPFQLSRPTIHEYLTLLERVFLVQTLPAWHTNRLSRLVKAAKLHIGDTGLAAALLGVDSRELHEDRGLFGSLLETFVFHELQRQASASTRPVAFHHFRDRDGYEVDLVLERGPRAVVGIEVKAAASVSAADFRGLRKLADIAGRRFVQGLILYDGERTLDFGDKFRAVPVRALWDTNAAGARPRSR